MGETMANENVPRESLLAAFPLKGLTLGAIVNVIYIIFDTYAGAFNNPKSL